MKLTYKIVSLPCAAVGGFTLLAVALVGQCRGILSASGADAALDHLLWELVVAGVVFCVVTGLAAWGVARRLSEPLKRISSVALEIADGDLSSAAAAMEELVNQRRVPSAQMTVEASGRLSEAIRVTTLVTADATGKLSEAIRTMTGNLSTLVGQVQRTSVQVISSCADLFSSAKNQESISTTQMKSMGVVGASMQEITDLATHLKQSFDQVLKIINTTTSFANSGQSDLMQMRTVMAHMTDASQVIYDRLQVIHNKSSTVTSIVTTVSKVADQTNFLALNALIEAERAGEYGRSFMVIAREIRRLADQTAAATVDIDTMVREIQSAITIGVQEMEDFMKEVRHSADDVGRIITKLAQVIEHVQGLSPHLTSIHTTVDRQSQNAQDINGAVTKLHQDTVRTMDAVQDAYTAISKLNRAAQDLQQEVSRFQVNFDLVKEFEIFTPFSEEARAYLFEHLHHLHFPSEAAIVHQGDTTDSLYIIAKGVVRITVRLPNGNDLEVARQGTGQVFGEISLLTGEPRTATVSALTDVELFEIRKCDIAPFIAEEPRTAEYLSNMLTDRKIDTATKCNKHEAQKLDRDAIYRQTLNKIQQFFELEHQ